ncbi:hypothetical protein ACFQX6_55915 [Streptosporangium lutulentum]
MPELAMIESHDVYAFKLGNPAHVRRVSTVRRAADPNLLFNHAISRLRTAAEALDRRTDFPTALAGD